MLASSRARTTGAIASAPARRRPRRGRAQSADGPKRAQRVAGLAELSPAASVTSRWGLPTSALSAAGVSSATMRPALMMPTRSASRSASSRYWVVRKTVVPSALSRRTSSHSVAARGRVEAGGRLVEEEDLRVVDQGHREVEATAHAARVRADPALLGVGQADALDQLEAAGAHRPRGDAVERGLELDQLASGHQRIEGRILERHADAAPDQGGLAGDVVTGDPGVAAGRAQERDEHPHRRRLAGPVRPEEPVDLALGDFDVDAADGLQAALELALESDRLDRRCHRGQCIGAMAGAIFLPAAQRTARSGVECPA